MKTKKPHTMKQLIFLLGLLLLSTVSLHTFAQSPTLQRELRLVNGGTYVGLNAAGGTSHTLTLPGTAPTANQLLIAGTLSGTSVPLSWSGITADMINGVAWSLTGNNVSSNSGNLGAAPVGNFLGAKDNFDLRFVTNNQVGMILTSGGELQTRAATVAGAFTVGNYASTLGGTLAVTGAGTFSSTMAVSGATTLGSTLEVTGASTLNGATTINNTLTVGSFATTLGGALSVTGAGTFSSTLAVGGQASFNAGVNLAGTASPLQLNGSVGTAGQVLVSAGDDATPTWKTLILGSGKVSVSNAETSIVEGITGLGTTEAIQVTLEGSTANMGIPSYYVTRSGTSFTIYFSAPFTGSYNWSVIKN